MAKIGQIIKNRYKLIDERGSGNFAVVYVARDLETNLLCALKVMKDPPADDESRDELMARFQREAHILCDLSDPHIVRLIDYDIDNTPYFMVMDYVDGHDLNEIMTRYGPLDLSRALDYTQQVAEGLDVADRKGIVHRDIKPRNILVNNKGLVKITDFGLALGRNTATLTKTDEFMGTIYYIAPEQVEHAHTVDTRADLYSLAIILFEMLIGHPPFGPSPSDLRNIWSVIKQHKEDKIPSLCRLRAGLPRALDDFVQKALAKSPDERYQTPREFLVALEQIIEEDPREVITKQAYLVIQDSGDCFPLTKQEMTVGRSVRGEEKEQPDIRLEDITVGRRHVWLRNREGIFIVEDRHSKNHTYLNGEELPPGKEHPLSDGDLLRFANVKARFELRDRSRDL